MMGRWAVFALLLAALSSVFFIPSDSTVEKKIKLPSIGLPALPSIDLALPRIDQADNKRRSVPVVETKIEDAPAVSLPLPLPVYYAYNEYHTYQRPIDVIADSLDGVPIGSCREEVRRATDVYGLSYPVTMAFALIESSCQPTQKTGSYIGLFQLSQYEFNRYGRSGGDVYNMRDNAMAAAHKFVVEAINFEHAVGRYPTPFDRYCIHQQGSEGCIQHQSQPDRIAWASMCATEEGKTKGEKWCRRAIWGNVPSNLKASIKGGVETLTSGAFLDIWRGRVVHFTKIMTGIREANAETSIVPSAPQVAEKPAEKTPAAETSLAKTTKVAAKQAAKKTAAKKTAAKKTHVAEKKSAKKTRAAEKKSGKKTHVTEKQPSKKAPAKKVSQAKSRPSG